MLSVPPDFGATPEDINSGAHALVGYAVDLTPEDGSARVVLQIEDRHLNRNGTLHGGIIAMMLDASAGFAASRALSPRDFSPVVTISLNTNYLAPARGGMVVTAIGRMTGGGASTVFSGAELLDAEGRLLASATGVFKRRRPPQDDRGT